MSLLHQTDLTGKATNSKAVGGTQPTALPSSPIRTVFLDGIVGLSKRAVKQVRLAFTFVRTFRSKKRDAPVRPRKNSAC